jgi:WD40 repeat protein
MRALTPAAPFVIGLLLGGLVAQATASPFSVTRGGEEKPARADRHGDALPAGAVARLGTQRFRSLEEVWDVAFSPNGRLLAVSSLIRVGCRGGDSLRSVVGLWDAATGSPVHTIEVGSHINSFAFSPDGAMFAVRCGGPVVLWDVVTGRKVRELPLEPGDPCTEIAFMPDSKTLAARRDDAAYLLDVATGKQRRRIGTAALPKLVPPGHSRGPIRSLAFSPDGRALVTGTEDGRQALWDVSTGKELRRFGPPTWGATAALSPDGKTLAVCRSDRPFALYDVAGGQERPRLEHQERHRQAAFSPDGKSVASWGTDRVLRLWDLSSGNVRQLAGPPPVERAGRGGPPSVHVTFSPDGKTLASWGHLWREDVVRLWDTGTGKELFPYVAHGRRVTALAFAPDGKTVVTAADDLDCCLLWDPLTGRQTGRLPVAPAQTGVLGSLCFSQGKLLGALAWSGGCHEWWEVGSGTQLHPFRPEGTRPYRGGRTGSAPDNKLATPPSPPGVHPYTRADVWSFGLTFLPGTRVVACALQDRAAHMRWDLPGSGGVSSTTGSRYRPAPALSADGRLLAAAGWYGEWGDDHVIFLWDVRPGKDCQTLNDPRAFICPRSEYVTAVALSPDGRMLASVHEYRTIRVWEVASCRERGRFRADADGVGDVAFSPDGTLLASTGFRTHTALVWDLAGRPGPGRPSARELDDWWAALAGKDADTAYRAVVGFASAEGRAVAFLKERLRRDHRDRLRRLLADLDAETYRARETASHELEELAARTGMDLRPARDTASSPEARRRLDHVLRRLAAAPQSPEMLRGLRALEALEMRGCAGARELLQTLAQGDPHPVLAREARRSLERLRARSAARPWPGIPGRGGKEGP